MRPFSKVVIAISVLISACTGGSKETAQDPIGTELSEFDKINKLILDDPDNPTGYYQRAIHRQQHDSLRTALADMERALKLDSSQAVYFETAGILRYQTSNFKGAMQAFEKCIALDDQNTECKFRKAEILLVLRRYQETLDLVNDALRIDENAAKGYYLKGWVYKELADSSLAISSLRTAVEQNPEYYDAWILLGLLHAAKGDDLALEYYNSAIEIKPHSTEAWYNKGIYAQETGLDSLALDCYAEIMVFDPKNPTAYFNSGWVELEWVGNNEMAIERFTKAIELLPEYHQAYYNRGLAYERKGELGLASDDYRSALSIKPDYDLAANGLDRMDKIQ